MSQLRQIIKKLIMEEFDEDIDSSEIVDEIADRAIPVLQKMHEKWANTIKKTLLSKSKKYGIDYDTLAQAFVDILEDSLGDTFFTELCEPFLEEE